jgi:hypothetical protein
VTVAEQRKRVAERIKELQPKVSNRAIAKTLGVGKDTVNRDLAGANAPPAVNERRNGKDAAQLVGANAPLSPMPASGSRSGPPPVPPVPPAPPPVQMSGAVWRGMAGM